MSDQLRVAVLWKQNSGYWDACMRALAELDGVAVWMAYRCALDDAPFDDARLSSASAAYGWTTRPGRKALRAHLEAFRPNVVMVSSWDIDDYRRTVRRWKGRAVRVLCMDNQWLATPKQRLGAAISPWYVRPAFDMAFMPGDTQAAFARRLGFPDEVHLRGLYCADHARFDEVAQQRTTPRRGFLFVGRLLPEKGVDVLATAYATYRAEVGAEAWPLRVAGTGPLESAFDGIAGVECTGFVQPDDLPSVLGGAGCLVLPSRFEPWGVVLHEAAAAGLPLIATSSCGGATRLLQDGYNGMLVPAGNADALAEAMIRMTRYTDEQRQELSQASRNLALQLTPPRWAQYVDERLREAVPRFVDG